MSDPVFVCGQTDRLGDKVSRWGIKTIRWTIQRSIPAIRDHQATLTRAMFAGISALCGLRFEETDNVAEANIIYSTGRGKSAGFDGPSGTLAFAYLPPTSSFAGQLGCYYDLDERWTHDDSGSDRSKIIFLGVARHETGHNLGLDHQNGPNLMAPIYDPNVIDWQPNDVRRLEFLYGKAGGGEAPATPPGRDHRRILELLEEANAEIRVVLSAGGIDLVSLRKQIEAP